MSKKSLIKRDLEVLKASLVALQDITLCTVDYSNINQVCGCSDWGFCFLTLLRFGGGLLSCWDKIIF